MFTCYSSGIYVCVDTGCETSLVFWFIVGDIVDRVLSILNQFLIVELRYKSRWGRWEGWAKVNPCRTLSVYVRSLVSILCREGVKKKNSPNSF